METGFESFSVEHLSTLLALGMITYVAISKGKSAEEPLKSDIGLIIAGLAFSTLLIEAIIKLAYGTYDFLVDLPLFMCDLVAMVLPFIIFSGNRKWIGILYFWALAGTMQALITPDVEAGFPSFHFFRYFIGHASIIIAVLYTVIVHRIRIGWHDFLNAIIYAQGYLVVIHIINQVLSSNYGYTMQKPPGPSILDLMGPWPWYILWGEFLIVFLYLLLLAPFLLWPAKPVALSQDKESVEGD
ncbi:MAG: TIGR02206 family membrane protein [Saprospiraceae bacterium]|nr:TIGR02206 family membrane protein [Saprospiraceae bacterium]